MKKWIHKSKMIDQQYTLNNLSTYQELMMLHRHMAQQMQTFHIPFQYHCSCFSRQAWSSYPRTWCLTQSPVGITTEHQNSNHGNVSDPVFTSQKLSDSVLRLEFLDGQLWKQLAQLRSSKLCEHHWPCLGSLPNTFSPEWHVNKKIWWHEIWL